jgi:hypothetical protein
MNASTAATTSPDPEAIAAHGSTAADRSTGL